MFEFSVEANPIQWYFANNVEAVFRISKLFLQVSFLRFQIWLEPNGPVIDCVLLSAGNSEESVSVFFSFEL